VWFLCAYYTWDNGRMNIPRPQYTVFSLTPITWISSYQSFVSRSQTQLLFTLLHTYNVTLIYSAMPVTDDGIVRSKYENLFHYAFNMNAHLATTSSFSPYHKGMVEYSIWLLTALNLPQYQTLYQEEFIGLPLML